MSNVVQAKVKGTNCANLRETVREQMGDARWNDLVSCLPDHLQTLALRKIFDVEWISLEEWMAIERAIFLRYCAGDGERFRLLSRLNTQRLFGGVYKFFLKVGSPGFVVAQATRVWSTYFTVGTLTVVKRPSRPTALEPVRFALRDFPAYEWLPYGVQGAMEQLLVMSRAHAPTVSIAKSDVVGGLLECEFHCVF